MYSPKYAVQENQNENERIIREHPFATIAYSVNDEPRSFHLPLFLENNSLVGHLARANPAWKELQDKSALIIFHGPNAYISPDYYGTEKNVPTWNYVTVHVRGKVTLREDKEFLRRALVGLSERHDPQFAIEKNIADHGKLLDAIVGIEVEVESFFGKFKLAQSKPEEERRNVIEALKGTPLAEEMKKTLSTSS